MWNIICSYPYHPSPYFSALDRALSSIGVKHDFFADIGEAINSTGIINLHRLQRLYYSNNTPTSELLTLSLSQLDSAKRKGLKIAWTVHNFLPIHERNLSPLDRRCVEAILDLADTIICHSNADARSIYALAPRANICVCGSAGIWMEDIPLDEHINPLLHSMDASEQTFLAFGHITRYKNLPKVASAFLASTYKAHLFIVGEARDNDLLLELREFEARSFGRIKLWPLRVNPAHAHLLYRKSAAAICSYASTGRYAYFRDILHPSSVATAKSFHVPIITPDLPSTREIAADVPTIFYIDDAKGQKGLEFSLCNAERRFKAPTNLPATAREEWFRIANRYKTVEANLC